MAIGEYKHRITFRTYESVPDGYGGTVDTPVDILTTWAKKVPLRASRELAENQLSMKSTNRYEVRYREGFEPTKSMRIVDEGEEYSINSIVPVKAEQRFWEIIAVNQE